MTSTAAEKPSKYAARRGAMLDAAASIFAQLGYHGASTGLIAEKVGIRQGSLYYYFASKEEALEEVCLKGVEDFVLGLTEIAKSGETVQARLRAAVLNHLRPLVERTDYVRTFINQRQFLPDASRKSVGRQTRQYEKLMIDLLRHGVMTGSFRSDLDCEVAALGLIGECNAVFMWYGKRAKGHSIEQIADTIATRFVEGAGA